MAGTTPPPLPHLCRRACVVQLPQLLVVMLCQRVPHLHAGCAGGDARQAASWGLQGCLEKR